MKTHLPCSHCGSSDALTLYDDGQQHCFSCSKHTFPKDGEHELSLPEYETYRYEEFRGVPQHTMEKYNAIAGITNGVVNEIIYAYTSNEVEQDQAVGKRRLLNPDSKGRKQFVTYGSINQAGLYGKHVHPPGSKRSVTITEGEQDALSLDSVVGDQTASVSVQSASTALRDVRNDREYLNSFDKIILWFDSDVVGQEALQKILSAGLFDFSKVFVVSDTKYKDANEYLQNGESRELFSVWKSAKRWTPDNIISSFGEIEAALDEGGEDCIGTYPFEELQINLQGLHRGEVVVIGAQEGVGKTSIFRAMEYHLLKTTSYNLGVIHLEENAAATIKGFASYELGLPAHIPDYGITNKQVLEAYKKAVSGDDSRVYLFSHFGAEEPDVIIDNIRFLGTVGGCQFIFLDHISILVTGLGDDSDERRKLDYISTKLKLLAKELGICIIMISHLNDDGKTRGSRNITKVANTFFTINRNKTAGTEQERNTTEVTIEKARLTGRTGPSGKLYYNPDTSLLSDKAVLSEVDKAFTEYKIAS